MRNRTAILSAAVDPVAVSTFLLFCQSLLF
jgi:hypothetical protein